MKDLFDLAAAIRRRCVIKTQQAVTLPVIEYGIMEGGDSTPTPLPKDTFPLWWHVVAVLWTFMQCVLRRFSGCSDEFDTISDNVAEIMTEAVAFVMATDGSTGLMEATPPLASRPAGAQARFHFGGNEMLKASRMGVGKGGKFRNISG